MAEVLIIDEFHPLLLEKLEASAITFHYQPNISPSDVLSTLQLGYKAVALRSKIHLNIQILCQLPKLKLIARGGAGMDNIDEEYATQNGMVCINAGEANSQSVGEHTVGLLLSLLHKISKSNYEIRNSKWQREANRGIELSGKTVGIIGFGNTGSAVAKCLLGFNVRILAYDKYKKGYGNTQVEEVSMQEIFELCDIVTLHIPLNGHTKNMVNTDYLQSFVRKIFLLNLSRGEIVCTKDVVYALKNGSINGFGADVLEDENIDRISSLENSWFKELIEIDEVVLTPHVAGWSAESYVKISEVLGDKIVRELAPGKGL